MSIMSTFSMFSLRRLSASKYSSQSLHDSSISSGVHFERECDLSSHCMIRVFLKVFILKGNVICLLHDAY
jgi:hypothetical protein